MARIITLTGPSQSGKSTAIDYFLSIKRKGYNPECIAKYTTREPREDDKSREVIYCDALPSSCDLVYQQYDNRYGLSLNSIQENLVNGITSIIVINDVRTISEVKRIFGPLCKSVFVFRKSPNYKEFKDEADSRGVTNEKIITKRLKKAEAIYRIYIENIHLFDNVIINAFNRTELKKQIKSIISNLDNTNLIYMK